MARKPIHPGEHLREELKELGMSAAELARRLNELRLAEAKSGNAIKKLPRLKHLEEVPV
jgi:transcriptional regulator with XRE-family HTH domain